MEHRSSRGFTLTEMLIGLAIASLAAVAVSSLLIQNARINKVQQMWTDVQTNARGSMVLVVDRLRSAGWDPVNVGIDTVRTDPDPDDDISQLEILSDLDEDGLTTGDGEQVLIRHIDDRIEMRTSSDETHPFAVVAFGITNDADGDGVVEPLFQFDDPTAPDVVVVQITAQSKGRDPRTGRFLRYTLRNEIALRDKL
jgi:prepilin-type N-terminal cleavage/methylation domain-containing protein